MPWQRKWWDEQVMDWAMRDEAVKVEMFRFVDVLPMLESSDDVVRHLHEYFADVVDRLPAALRVGLPLATPGSVAGYALAKATRIGARNPGPAVYRRLEHRRSCRSGAATARVEPSLHARYPRRGGHQRRGGRSLLRRLPGADSRHSTDRR